MSENNLQKLNPKALYVVTVMLGLFVILLSKYLQIPNLIYVLLISIIILGYVFISYKFQHEKLSKSQLADNTYYLGFIITIISLSVSLIFIDNNRDNFIFSIIQSFGVALTSTIIGVLVRVVLLQDDDEELIRNGQDIVRNNLQDSIKTFSNNIRSFNQYIEETMTKKNYSSIPNAIEQTMTDFVSLNDNLKKKGEEIKENYGKYADKLSVTLEGIDNVNKSLSKTAGSFNNIGANIGKLKDLEKLNNLEKLSHLNDINQIEFGKIIQLIEYLKEIENKTKSINKEMKKIKEKNGKIENEKHGIWPWK